MRTGTPKIAIAALATATAALISAGSAPAATGHNWQTCKPGAKEYLGAYRVFDNAWLGPSSKDFCVSSTGLNVTIDSNAISDGGQVVAYPSARFGPFEADGDPRSGGPWRVTQIGSMTLHVASRGKMDGPMQSDADLWFRPRANWTLHGTYEMVLINRRTTSYPRSALHARIRAAKYRYLAWTTCQPGSTAERRALADHAGPLAVSRPVLHAITPQAMAAAGCVRSVRPWTILVFWRVHQKAAVALHVGNFVWHALHLTAFALPRKWWLGDAAYGTELWSRGKGVTTSMRVTWSALPVLNPAPTRAALASAPILRPAPRGPNTIVVARWLIAVAAIIAVGVAAAIRWPTAPAALVFWAGYAAGVAWAKLRSFGTWLLEGVKRMIE